MTEDKCDKYQPCQYRFAGMCMYNSNIRYRPCEEFSVGTCETNETLIQEAKHES